MLFANQEEMLYHDNCCHLNRLGYGLIGRAIVILIADTMPVKTYPGDAPRNLQRGRVMINGDSPRVHFPGLWIFLYPWCQRGGETGCGALTIEGSKSKFM